MATDLIFDFFGTLVQYTAGPFHTAPYHRTHDYIRQQGFMIEYDAFVAAFVAVSQELETRARQGYPEYHMAELGRQFFRSTFATEVPDAVITSFVTVFLEEWGRGIVHMEALAPFLERLASRYRLSILSNTNYPPLIHDNLAAMGVAHHFTHVITSVEVGIRKPHPAIFQHALEQLGIGPDDAIYIGDTFVDDYQGATASGIKCFLIDAKSQWLDVPDRIETLFALEQHLEQPHTLA